MVLLGGHRLWFRYNLAGPLYNEQIRKLMRADNRERALKLASSVPDSPYTLLTTVALTRRLPVRDPEASMPADYRSAREERSFEERVRSMLDEERVRRIRAVTRAAMLTALGAVVLLGVSAIAQRLGFVRPLASLGIAIALILLAVRALATRAKIRRELVELQLLLEPFVQREQ
jgi:hypothetical protein